MYLTPAVVAAMPQRTVPLPITCMEGSSADAEWTGVRVRDLALRYHNVYGPGMPRREATRHVPISRPDIGERTIVALPDAGLVVRVGPTLRDVETAEGAYAVAALGPTGHFAAAIGKHPILRDGHVHDPAAHVNGSPSAAIVAMAAYRPFGRTT